jgi:hypothetical protein
LNSIALSVTYLGPVQWYQKLRRSNKIYIDSHEHFVKQTYRNRCRIATNHGVQMLTVPVTHDSAQDIRDIRLSDHGHWQHLHWQALQSAYGESPFFEYYMDDLRPFYEKRWTYLYDFDMELTHLLCGLLDICPQLEETPCYLTTEEWKDRQVADYRYDIRPKSPPADPAFYPQPYYQMYKERWGFRENLSIVDLLFNEGNESIFYL